MNSIPTKNCPTSTLSLFIGVLLIASVLRAPITSVGPLLGAIQIDLGLTPSAAGVLTSLPVVIFAVVPPLLIFTRKIGIERSLMLALAFILVGIFIRSAGFSSTLFAGTIILSIGIAVGNVLLPIMLKREFPQKITLVTAFYVICMITLGAISSGIAVPVAALAALYFSGEGAPLSWQTSLAFWSILIVVAMFIWRPQARCPKDLPEIKKTDTPAKSILKSPLAWQVTVFMGFQSMYFYVLIGWLASILQDSGHNAQESGWLVAFYQVIGLISCLIIPFIVSRTTDQRFLAAISGIFCSIGAVGLLLSPEHAFLWLTLTGLSSGTSFVLAIAFINMRTNTPQQAASLSVLINGGGYSIAALGPFLFGVLHDITHSWTFILLGLALGGVIQSIFGLLAGRNKTIDN